MMQMRNLPFGNGAKDFPQPFCRISASSASTRWPSASVPQKKGTLPSASWNRKYPIQQGDDIENQIKESIIQKIQIDELYGTEKLLTAAMNVAFEVLSYRMKENFPWMSLTT